MLVAFLGSGGSDFRGTCTWLPWEALRLRCAPLGGLPLLSCLPGTQQHGAWLSADAAFCLDGSQGWSPGCLCLPLGSRVKAGRLSLTGQRCCQRQEAWLAGFPTVLQAHAFHPVTMSEAPRTMLAPASCHFCTFTLGVQLLPISSQQMLTLLCRERSVWLLGTQEHLQVGPGSPQLPRARAEGGMLGERCGDSYGTAAHLSRQHCSSSPWQGWHSPSSGFCCQRWCVYKTHLEAGPTFRRHVSQPCSIWSPQP